MGFFSSSSLSRNFTRMFWINTFEQLLEIISGSSIEKFLCVLMLNNGSTAENLINSIFILLHILGVNNTFKS